MSEDAVKKMLPATIEPRKFTAQSVLLEGIVPGDKLPRLLEANASAGQIRVSLEFGYDEERRRTVTGTLDAEIEVECQRCLKPMPVPVAIQVSWAIVWDEERAKQLPARFEPWIVEDETASLYAAVEEELLLALPTAPMHTNPCIDSELLQSGDDVIADIKETTNNPFKVLESLKGKTKH